MSKKQRIRRGVSFGSIFMLALTLLVLGSCAFILPKLQGDTQVKLDVVQVLSNIDLSGTVPELGLTDIPIFSSSRDDGGESAPSAQATALPTIQPEVLATLTTPVSQAGSFTMTIGGSLCVEEGVRKSAYYSETKTYDFSDILSLLSSEMQSDLCMLSLDDLLSTSGKYSDTVTPEAALSLLTTTGVDIATLGFAGAYDQGLSGLEATIDAVKGKGIAVAGAFSSAESAAAPTLLTAGNMKLAVLHYTDELTTSGAKKIKKEDAAWAVPLADPARIAEDIQKARSAGAQVVIVSLRWGKVGKTDPTDAQKTLAQQIAGSGADLIVGTGTKVVQPVVWLTGQDSAGQSKQVLCAYNLGTLLSDARSKSAYIASILLQLRFTSDANGNVTLEKAEYTPTYAWRYKTGSQYQYRVVAADKSAPDAMSSDQQDTMQKALTTLQKALAGSVVTVRAQ